MDVQVVILEHFTIFWIQRFYKCQGDLDGFFHYISELSCDLDLAFPACELCLDEKDGAACARPRQSGHDSRRLR